MDAQKLTRYYKKYSSGYDAWDQKEHSEDYLLFPNNAGEYMAIDEVSLSKGELYTILTNKAGKGKQGTMVAVIKGTLSSDILKVLKMLPARTLATVKEVTLDMAKNMELAARVAFPNASLVTDRFHVVKLAMEVLQHLRVELRWEELDKENKAIKQAKEKGEKYEVEELENGDTPKQLLARCRYILAKKENEWTENQSLRASILFERYPLLEKTYHHVLDFRNIYEEQDIKNARVRFVRWIQKVHEEKMEIFYTVANTVKNNFDNILNFFINRNTNANAESFNSKIKLFRANQRGVVDTKFFLFRLHKLFA